MPSKFDARGRGTGRRTRLVVEDSDLVNPVRDDGSALALCLLKRLERMLGQAGFLPAAWVDERHAVALQALEERRDSLADVDHGAEARRQHQLSKPRWRTVFSTFLT
jgi:hypothetical protein